MPPLREFIGKLNRSRGTAHLMGLLSPGGVHSHQHQIAALAGILARPGCGRCPRLPRRARHAAQAAASYLENFDRTLPASSKFASPLFAAVIMRWIATSAGPGRKSYRLIVQGAGESAGNPRQGVAAAYARGETDEFVQPTAIAGYPGCKTVTGC